MLPSSVQYCDVSKRSKEIKIYYNILIEAFYPQALPCYFDVNNVLIFLFLAIGKVGLM